MHGRARVRIGVPASDDDPDCRVNTVRTGLVEVDSVAHRVPVRGRVRLHTRILEPLLGALLRRELEQDQRKGEGVCADAVLFGPEDLGRHKRRRSTDRHEVAGLFEGFGLALQIGASVSLDESYSLAIESSLETYKVGDLGMERRRDHEAAQKVRIEFIGGGPRAASHQPLQGRE